jgi:uncharacterized protein (TIGR03000 family)
MLSVMLATMLTAGTATPAWGGKWCHGCSGCFGARCSGCHGCSGCYGCSGCSGCYGCSGYAGCSGCWNGCSCAGGSPWYWSCSGCWGGTGSGCAGCWGVGTACHGCYGGAHVATASTRAVTAPTMGTATVKVQLPAEAKLYVDSYASKQTSASRTIVTPALEGGQDYVYTLRVEMTRDGRPTTATKDVTLRAGMALEVDFGDLTQAATVRSVPAATGTQVSRR